MSIMMKQLRDIILFGFLVGTSLIAGERRVEVRPGGDEFVETEPKQTVTTVFYVANHDSSSHEFISEIGLPENWKLITQELPFRLDAYASDMRLLSFYIPQTAHSGHYQLSYRVVNREFPSMSDFFKIYIHVLPVQELNVQVIEAPENIVAGEDFKVVFLVSNRSNIEDSIAIDIISDPDFSLSVSSEGFTLSAGESRTVSATVHTDVNDIKKLIRQRINLTARFVRNDQVSAKATRYIEIIPKKQEKVDRYHRIPVNVSLRYVLQKNGAMQSGTQLDINGNGTLDENGERHIQFRMRAPDIYDKSVLAEHDEFFVSYHDDKVKLHLGDRNYTLSPLTEKSRYGRGGEINLTFNRFQLGVFYQKTRWLLPKEEKVASYIQYDFSKRASLKLNYLKKWIEKDDRDIISLQGMVVPYKDSKIEIEYASGSTQEKRKNAYWLKLTGNHTRFNYYINWIHADSLFPGYYENMNYTSGGLFFDLIRNLRFEMNMRQNRDLYYLRSDYASVLNQYAHLALRYKLGRGPIFRLGVIQRKREDLQPSPKFNYEDRTGRLELTQYFKSFNFSIVSEFGETLNKMQHETAWTERYTLSVRFRPSPQQSYRGYLYFDDNQRYDNVKKRRLTVGFNADLLIFENTSLYFNFQNNYTPDDYYNDRNVFDLRITHRFPFQHRLSLNARYTLLKNSFCDQERALMVQYDVPIGIPTVRKKNTGVVKGHVYDAETGEPIDGLIIRINGSTAVTDRNGYFIFPTLKPESYYLRIDKTEIGLNRVAVQKTPMEITVQGGDEQYLELNITDGAIFSGQIMVYSIVNDSSDHFSAAKMKDHLDEYFIAGNGNGHKNVNGNHVNGNGKNGNGKKTTITNGKTKLIKDYPAQNILVELKRDDEMQRRITDMHGRFLFEELRPGKWNVKVYTFNLPEYHRLKKESFALELKPGEKKEMEMKVVPRQRKIQFLQEGGTIKEESN